MLKDDTLLRSDHARSEPMLLVAEPTLGQEEKAALASVIDSGWITMGSRVRAFEQAFAAEHGVDDAVAVSSCTAALHLILAALGVGPGDEVLVPSLTFIATINSVLYCGARPVFVDIESCETPILSLADAARKVTPRTKAVVVMHYGGYLADAAAWTRLARSLGLFLIEDSAHALGAARGPIYGDAAAFSFFGNKNMTTAEGGMVTARDPGVLALIRQARGHGMTTGTTQRLRDGSITYDVTMLGWNYRMDELRAAIGLVQLRKLGSWITRRQELTALYRGLLGECCPSVTVPFREWPVATPHILPIVLPPGVSPRHVAEGLRAQRIQTTNHYPPAHLFSWHSKAVPSTILPETESFAARELTLPLHPGLSRPDVVRV
ncbi:MAG: DegT/DnrJ/EryC1/StrS aminotransferase family protein, partial [Acetobacteraceae bacterium]|nr:DegT/DnrJ/EryC1/StrS aminotransferase family protein [Acetobacteraceae bacterium]